MAKNTAAGNRGDLTADNGQQETILRKGQKKVPAAQNASGISEKASDARRRLRTPPFGGWIRTTSESPGLYCEIDGALDYW